MKPKPGPQTSALFFFGFFVPGTLFLYGEKWFVFPEVSKI